MIKACYVLQPVVTVGGHNIIVICLAVMTVVIFSFSYHGVFLKISMHLNSTTLSVLSAMTRFCAYWCQGNRVRSDSHVTARRTLFYYVTSL